MNDDPGVVEGKDAVGLVTMCQKAARDSVSHHQRDHWMPFHPRGRISIRSRRSGQEDSGGLLAAAVRLTLYVHDTDDRTLLAVLVLLDRFAQTRRQRVRLLKSDFSMPRTGKASVGVWHYAEVARRVFTELGIRREYGARVSYHRRILAGKRLEPCLASKSYLFAHCAPPSVLQSFLNVSVSIC